MEDELYNNIMKKYNHNVVSVNSPEHFRRNFSVILKNQ